MQAYDTDVMLVLAMPNATIRLRIIVGECVKRGRRENFSLRSHFCYDTLNTGTNNKAQKIDAMAECSVEFQRNKKVKMSMWQQLNTRQ